VVGHGLDRTRNYFARPFWINLPFNQPVMRNTKMYPC
jgi:hypothetical protein